MSDNYDKGPGNKFLHKGLFTSNAVVIVIGALFVFIILCLVFLFPGGLE